LFRGQNLDHCRRLYFLKSVGNGLVRKLELRWLESVEEALNNKGVRNWSLA
jgi:hypothetical protein